MKALRKWEQRLIKPDEDSVQDTEVCCAHFGCGIKLTREEALCGDKCLEHMKSNRWDYLKNYLFKMK